MILLYAVPLFCAAMSDWRRRVIPDWTWVAILAAGIICALTNGKGILYIPLCERFIGLLYPAACLLVVALKWGGVGGGDIKLTAALGFAFGLYGLMFILFFAVIPACIYAGVTRQKSVPLAVFLGIGFLAFTCLHFLAG